MCRPKKSSIIIVGLSGLLAAYGFSELAEAQDDEKPYSTATDWHQGYTLIVMDNTDIASANQARDYVISQGGKIAILAPPHIMLGWISPELDERLIGKFGIEQISHSPVDLARFKYHDKQTSALVSFFNYVSSGTMIREKMGSRMVKGQPLIDDARKPPPINFEDYQKNLKMFGVAPSLENSDSMTGTVAVCLFFVESDGSIDQNRYTWNSADEQITYNRAVSGLSWWSDQAPRYGNSVSFTFYSFSSTDPVSQQGYEPIRYASDEDYLWINQIMANRGFASGNALTRVTAFNTWLKESADTDWSYSVFIGYNPSNAPDTFTDGYFAYAYLGGPYSQMLFRNDGWNESDFGNILAHETGHIFWACDEYYSPGYGGCESCDPCATEGPRPNVLNGNCEHESCNPNPGPCIMRSNSDALCTYTPLQIGWSSPLSSIMVTSPASGASWEVSSSQTISWTSTGVTGEVNIKLSTNGGASFPVRLASSTTNDGSKSITVPNNPSTTCRIRVESVSDPSVFGDNPGNFTIQQSNNCLLTWQAGMTVRDVANNSANLSFGQGSDATECLDTACDETELPPSPPTGVFDARFELPCSPAVASLKDYRNDELQTVSWRMKFQSSVSGGMTLSWNLAEFPPGSFFLKDEITGTLVNVNMKSQSSYTLTTAGITSLKIDYSQEECRAVSVTSNWNIVSVPVRAADMEASSLFPGAVSPAFGFNNGYVAATILQPGVGYWIRFASSNTFTICGPVVTPKEVPVNAGWNVIGPFDSDIAVSSIASVPDGIVVSGYFGYNNGYVSDTALNVGKGYWVRVSQGGFLRIPEGSVSATKLIGAPLPVSPEVKDSWPRILIEDSAGHVGTLYLSPASEINGAFELPPIPPVGVFDVRFSGDRYVVSKEERQYEIQLNSAKYPARLRSQGLEAGRVLRVKDVLNGKVLDERLIEGRDIVISTPLDRIFLEAEQLPVRYELSQNYPNPFNPTTVVKFSIPEKVRVRLDVFNLLGEKVMEVLNQEMEAGEHQVHLDARNYSAGIYFYVIEAGNFKDVKKIMVIK